MTASTPLPASTHAIANINEEGIATLIITQAGTLNILGTPVINALTQAVQALARQPGVRVLVLRGSGDKALIGGADIKEMATLDRERAVRFISGLRDLCESLRQFPAPVIARMAGWCLGGGLEVAMACDLRIASDDAHFGMPEVKVGIPSVIHATLLPRLVGQSRAGWMLLTGETIDASQALAWGLVHEVAPLDLLDVAVLNQASALAAMGPAALRQQKRLMRAWEDEPLAVSIANSVAEFGQAFETGEPQRFMNAFLDSKAAKAGRSA